MAAAKELSDLKARLEAVPEEIGAIIVEAEFSADDRAVVTADVFFRLAKHLRPKVIYANVEKFDARREVALRVSGVQDMVERRGLEEDEQVVKGVRKLLVGLAKGRTNKAKGRTNKAKRLLLAKTMFPDLPDAVLNAVIKQTEAELWLANT